MAKTLGTIFDAFEKKHQSQWHRIETALNILLKGQETIMTQLDDLRATLTEIGTNVAAIRTNAGELKDDVTGVDTKVKTLIDMIQNQPPGQIPEDIITLANSLKADTAALVTDTQSVEDQIAAIPGVPEVTPPPPAPASASGPQSMKPADGSKK